MFMYDNQTRWEGAGYRSFGLVLQESRSSADLIGPGRKPEHREAFANQCHHPTHTHGPAYSNTAECCARARVMR